MRQSNQLFNQFLVKQERKVAVLPQDELAAFRSVPMLSVSSGAGGVCSARDFHNVKVLYTTVCCSVLDLRFNHSDFTLQAILCVSFTFFGIKHRLRVFLHSTHADLIRKGVCPGNGAKCKT